MDVHPDKQNIGVEALKKDIEEIKERNRGVELDKMWETSYARRALLIWPLGCI